MTAPGREAAAPRVAIVTGASSGLGKEVARALLAKGWRVIGMGRDPGRCAAAEAELGTGFTLLRGDLSRMRDTTRLADAISALTDRIDLLANNAGGMTTNMVVTEEGLEEGFAANHLGAFLLTERLLPLLRRAAEGTAAGRVRIVTTSSSAAQRAPRFDWDDVQLLRSYDSGRAYCQAKLANLLFTRALARRLDGSGIVAHAVHPGAVGSNFFNRAEPQLQAYARTLDLLSVEQGADTLIWTCTADAPGRTTGGYFFERAPLLPPPTAQDDADADRLWMESAALIGTALSR